MDLAVSQSQSCQIGALLLLYLNTCQSSVARHVRPPYEWKTCCRRRYIHEGPSINAVTRFSRYFLPSPPPCHHFFKPMHCQISKLFWLSLLKMNEEGAAKTGKYLGPSINDVTSCFSSTLWSLYLFPCHHFCVSSIFPLFLTPSPLWPPLKDSDAIYEWPLPSSPGCDWLGRLRRLFFGSKSIVSDSDPSRRHDTWLRIYTIISRLSLLAYTAAVNSTTLNQSQVVGGNLNSKDFRNVTSLNTVWNCTVTAICLMTCHKVGYIPMLNISCGRVVRDFESEAKTRCNFQFW